MKLLDFGAGFLAGLAGGKLFKKLLSLVGAAIQGAFKVFVNATRQQFNLDVKAGKFNMKTAIADASKEYGGPSNLRKLGEWVKNYSKEHRYRGFLIQGQLFAFDYDDPLTKDQLEYYDTTPVVLAFGMYAAKTGNLVEYGINLHFLPQNVREAFLTDIFDLFRKQYNNEMYSDKLRSVNEFTWQTLQTFVDKYGIDFAVRSYIPDRRKHCIVFEYSDWGIACQIPSKEFIGITDEELLLRYKLHLANTKRNIE